MYVSEQDVSLSSELDHLSIFAREPVSSQGNLLLLNDFLSYSITLSEDNFSK